MAFVLQFAPQEFVNVPRLKGSHNAIKTGMLAAEAAVNFTRPVGFSPVCGLLVDRDGVTVCIAGTFHSACRDTGSGLTFRVFPFHE